MEATEVEQEKRISPPNLPDRIEHWAAYAVTEDHDEAKFVHDEMRFHAGLLKTRATLPGGAHLTVLALRRQANTLYRLAAS